MRAPIMLHAKWKTEKNPHSRGAEKRQPPFVLLFINSVLHAEKRKKLKKKPQHFCLSTRTPATDCDYNSLTQHIHKLYEIMESIAGMKQLACLSLLAILSTGNVFIYCVSLFFFARHILFLSYFCVLCFSFRSKRSLCLNTLWATHFCVRPGLCSLSLASIFIISVYDHCFGRPLCLRHLHRCHRSLSLTTFVVRHWRLTPPHPSPVPFCPPLCPGQNRIRKTILNYGKVPARRCAS